MGLCMPQGVEKLALERGDAAADGGKDEAGGQTDGLWVCQPGSSVILPAHPRSCQFFPLLASPKRSCHYQSENKSKVTAWEMRFRNYPFERTKQTMPNVSALKVWHLTRGRGWPVSFWAADVLSLGVVPVLLEQLQVCQEWRHCRWPLHQALMKLLLICLLRMGFKDLIIRVGSMRLEFREGPIKYY